MTEVDLVRCAYLFPGDNKEYQNDQPGQVAHEESKDFSEGKIFAGRSMHNQ